MNEPHLEVIRVHHPVIQHRNRDLRFRCNADVGNQESFLAAMDGAYFCAACGNVLGFQGQLRITYRHENGHVYMAFL